MDKKDELNAELARIARATGLQGANAFGKPYGEIGQNVFLASIIVRADILVGEHESKSMVLPRLIKAQHNIYDLIADTIAKLEAL